ncbi:surfactin synthase thioesterase subunit [Rathayibacter agropyri]
MVPRALRVAARAAGFGTITAVDFESPAARLTHGTIEMLAALSITAARGTFADAVLYGHSMGGLIAFEVCRQLAAVGTSLPGALILGGTASPGTPMTVAQIGECLGIPPSPRLPHKVRARLGIERSRAYAPRPAPIDIDLHLLYGSADALVRPESVTGWKHFGCRTVRSQTVEGGHLFHQSMHGNLSQALGAVLSGMVSSSHGKASKKRGDRDARS